MRRANQGAPAAASKPFTSNSPSAAGSEQSYQVLGGPCLDVVRRSLAARGWKDSDGGNNSMQSDAARAKSSGDWRFQWGVRASYVRHSSLKPNQVCNYLQGSVCLSSKLQLRTNLETSQRWNFDTEAATWLPRCYDITPPNREDGAGKLAKSKATDLASSSEQSGDVSPGDEEWVEFQQRFQSMQAVNVCRYILWRCNNNEAPEDLRAIINGHSFPAADLYDPSVELSPRLIELALIGVKQYLQQLRYESTSDEDEQSSSVAVVPNIHLSSDERSSIDLAALSIIRNETSVISSITSAIKMPVEFIREVSDSLHAVDALDIQSALNRRNLWILKPSALSRGRGIQTVGCLAEIHRIIHSSSEDAVPSSTVASAASSSNQPIPSVRVKSARTATKSKHVNTVNPRRATLNPASAAAHTPSSSTSTPTPPPLDSTSRTCKFLIQKYIENPLLVQKKKFDIRQWIVITGFQGKRNVWIWGSDLTLQDFHDQAQVKEPLQSAPSSIAVSSKHEGEKQLSAASHGFYLRFSSFDFSLLNLNSSIHLTNNSIQKTYTDDFNQLPFDAPGNMWSREQFLRFLIDLHGGDVARAFQAWRDDVWSGIKKLTMAVVEAAEEKIVYQDNCYEIFGLDVMIAIEDIPATPSSPASFRLAPLLLEVNSSPTMVGIHVPNLVDMMVEDLLSVVLDDRDSMFQASSRQPSANAVKRAEKVSLAASTGSSSAPVNENSVAQSSSVASSSSDGASLQLPTIRSAGGWSLISSIPRNLPVRGGIDLTVRGTAMSTLNSKKLTPNPRG